MLFQTKTYSTTPQQVGKSDDKCAKCTEFEYSAYKICWNDNCYTQWFVR